MSAPRATLRLQLHRGFGFAAARERIGYFRDLGISHLYLSPIATARAGSMHGYDVTDPSTINPELGGEMEFIALARALREAGLGVIVDIVPNHIAAAAANPWWSDVLEWGRASPFARFFDIDWDVPDPALRGRVVAPFLGKPYGEALAAGEIGIVAEGGRLRVRAGDLRFPLAPECYAALLPARAPAFQSALRLPRAQRRAAFEQALAAGVESPASLSSAALHALLERQHYRLAWWRTAADEINWRRFFDVTDLVALDMRHAAAFEAVHALPLQLYAGGWIDGVRVDHVDGLADPRAYCRALRRRLQALASRRPEDAGREPPYLVVEKILAPGETLPRGWRTDGTTGYAFMNQAGAVLHDPAGADPLRALWHRHSGRSADFADEERAARRRISQDLFAADLRACALALHAVARSDPATRDWTLGAIQRVLVEVLAHFPVYRTYADAQGRNAQDREVMRRAFEAARPGVRPGEQGLVDLVDRWLGGEAPASIRSRPARALRLRAIARFQQLTSPVAAKAVEDTAFYRHGTLLSRNEVGADPGEFALDRKAFHEACLRRRRNYPRALLATATHDNKRGEDVRARLAVLSEMPGEWAGVVEGWARRHEALRADGPDATDEYLLYQTLVGAWPLDLRPDDSAGLAQLRDRVLQWQEKALREAKRITGWTEPNPVYEAACRGFVEQLFSSREFLASLAEFVQRIAPAGAVNGLSQALLRMTAPGVPDLYQGTELWDFSLVDPDNRRPVDWNARERALGEEAPWEELLGDWTDGRIKQRVIARVLGLRAQDPELFALGAYLPVTVSGGEALAHARVLPDRAVLVVAPRLPARHMREGLRVEPPGRIRMPPALRKLAWRDAFTGTEAVEWDLAALLRRLPIAVLVGAAVVGAARGRDPTLRGHGPLLPE